MYTKCKITKEEHIYTSEEKLKFLGYGEWIEEPDFVAIEYFGYEATVRRVLVKEPWSTEECYFGGHLCGYVRIPENHPYFIQEHEDMDISAHCGLTYGEKHEQYWIGFDCAHAGDLIPSSEFVNKKRRASGEPEPFPIPKGFEDFSLFHSVYRNMKFCIEECMHIIDQLINIRFENNVKTSAEALEEQRPS